MKIIAHRGFSSRAPENTLAAFGMAVEFGVDGLEFDVHLSKDGEVVICHDEAVDRTTDGEGLIKDFTWEELRRLDAGSWFEPRFVGERIPRLSDLLELVAGTRLLLNIELKTNIFPYPGIEEKVIQMVKNFGIVNRCIISSFNHHSLLRAITILPELKTGALYEADLFKPWEYAETFGAAALHPEHHSVTPELVREARHRGIMVNPWTVNEPVHMERMIAAAVDGIITNYPDVAKQVLQNTSRR
ncbi:glycerophosphoryl diester phosphodiesterase [Hydrogenispora ethanolica]|uniref:Glycerophosphoryl diester phosphodiesterase n=1 Tax=Hydrogenispora ethanolica TaxID=1082276 RepID=A0A4R1RSN3_HYDET|nr:glycerophosphodiester phosphodiesterase [Hydrogenispora ethanolica]TCL69394.1 glycerophosphoryl diester phosphodiesterase [Hydrogenispora ethanolica]